MSAHYVGKKRYVYYKVLGAGSKSIQYDNTKRYKIKKYLLAIQDKNITVMRILCALHIKQNSYQKNV